MHASGLHSDLYVETFQVVKSLNTRKKLLTFGHTVYNGT